MKQRLSIIWLVGLLFALANVSYAQPSGTKPKVLEGVGVEEHLGETIPLDLTFTNENGKQVNLQSYFDGETPVLLNFGYYNCPMLCDRVWDGMIRSLQGLNWAPGDKFKIVTISIAPGETSKEARAKHKQLRTRLSERKGQTGWYFHTGQQSAVDTLTKAVGFNYVQMEKAMQMDKSVQQYAHPAVLMALSGEGKITRYLYGLQYESREMKNALLEASNGQVGGVVDQVILYCSQYDPNANKYVADAWAIMRLGGVLTVIILGSVLFVYWRREHRQRQELINASAD